MSVVAVQPDRPANFFGWKVVRAAFVVAVFAWGIGFYGPPIFLGVLHDSKGWPVSVISAAITAHFLFGALAVANLAALHARFGVVRVTQVGALLTSVGLVGWAFSLEAWQLFLITPISGAGWAMTSGAALNAMVSPWFSRKRPAALGMAFNGASMGGVLFSPLWVVLIAWLGFGGASVLVAVVVASVVGVIAGRYLTATPSSMGLSVDGEAGDASVLRRGIEGAAVLGSPWRDRRFMTLAGASMVSLFAQIGLVAHLFSLLAPVLGAAWSGLVMGGVTACALAGRTLVGRLMPVGAERRMVAAGNVGLQAVGSVVLLLAGDSVPPLLLGCGLFGLGLGNVTSLPPLIAQSEFRPADVGRVVAWVTAIGQAGYSFAPVSFSLLREGAGASPMLFAAAAVLQLLAAWLTLAGRKTAET